MLWLVVGKIYVGYVVRIFNHLSNQSSNPVGQVWCRINNFGWPYASSLNCLIVVSLGANSRHIFLDLRGSIPLPYFSNHCWSGMGHGLIDDASQSWLSRVWQLIIV